MNVTYFIAGLIFLLNPNYGIIDVLPDVIGYFLILRAIEHAADMYEYISDAKNLLSKLCVISIAKLAATVLCSVTDETFVLVLTFGFVIVELIYILPAFMKLYNGIGYSAMRLGIPEVPEATSRVRNLTVAFFAVRGVAALIPELTSLLYSISRLLSDSEYPATLKRNLSWICIPLMLAFSVMVAIRTIRYVRLCGKNQYSLMVERAYELHFSGRYGIFRSRLMNTGFSCLTIAAVFSLDFHFDQMDVIPDAAGAVLLLIAVFMLAAKRYERIVGGILFVGYTASSILNIFACHRFDEEYSLRDVFYTASTTEKYVELEILTGAECFFGLASFIFVLILIYKLVKRNAKAYCHRLYAVNPDDCAQDFVDEVRRSLIGAVIFAALHFTGKLMYILILPYSNVVSVLSFLTTVLLLLKLMSLSTLVRQGLGERIREY